MRANIPIAIEYGIAAAVLLQPKPPLSMASVNCFPKTLHAYRVPKARFKLIPEKVTSQPFLLIFTPFWSIFLKLPHYIILGEEFQVKSEFFNKANERNINQTISTN
jgi:hypothetical protein